MEVGWGRRLVCRYIDRNWLVRPSAVIRTQLIDDAVTAAIEEAEQLAILGGQMTRGLRLPAMRTGLRARQPLTQGRKKQGLKHGTAIFRQNVTYVPLICSAGVSAPLETGRVQDQP